MPLCISPPYCFLKTVTLRPGESATKDYLVPNLGCGSCADGADNTTCTDCGTDSCNSAVPLSLFIAPLIALLISLI